MRRFRRKFLKIAFFIARSTMLTREWFRGTMLYARQNPKWFVRAFEVANGKTETLLDFGPHHPDGIIACGVPARFLRDFFRKRGAGDVPIMAFPQAPYPEVGTVTFDYAEIAAQAIGLFKRRGCRHVVYIGGHLRNGVRFSRAFAKAFAAEAGKSGIGCTIPRRKVYAMMGLGESEAYQFVQLIEKIPKPCGVLTYNDIVGRTILDLCRLWNISVPESVCVLGMDNNELFCESSYPSLSSVELDYVRTGYQAAKALDDMICGRTKDFPRLTCGIKEIVERASTQDPKGSGRLVANACDFIAKNACREGGIDQCQIAANLGVSVRTLQLRFKESGFPRTILQEIQRVQLANACRLLMTTSIPVSEVIVKSGFGSASSAMVLFHKKKGMSMRTYRNSHIRKKENE